MTFEEDIAEIKRSVIRADTPEGLAYSAEVARRQPIYDAKLSEMQISIGADNDHARSCLESLIEWARHGIPVLALMLALLPSLALAGPLVVTKDTKVNNTYRWLDGRTRDLGGLVFDGKEVTVSRNVIRFYKATDSNTVVRNAKFYLAKPTVNPGDLPVAIAHDAGTNHLVENVEAHDFRSAVPGQKYENGDCFSGERPASNITFRNVLASNCSDGGFDYKSKDVRFENTIADGAGKGYRIWGTATASTITCRRWHERCIQMNWGDGAHGNPSSFTVDKLILEPTADSGAMTFATVPGTTLNVKTCRGSLNAAPAKVIWYDEHATPQNTDLTLCGVKVAGQSDAQLRAEIEAKIKADTEAEARAPLSATTSTKAATVAAKPLCTFSTKLIDRSGDGVITLTKVNAAKCGGKAGMRVRLVSEQPGAFGYGLAN